MREILFRGKNVNNLQWLYGCYYHCSGTAYGAVFIVENDFGFIEVIPHTVGQYTGLTDCNGKRIFEGDIVRGKDYLGGRREGEVRYNECSGMWEIIPNTKSFYREEDCVTTLAPAEGYLEVIGNIYDNPELLKKE